jgi:hypothetical protein
MPRAAEPATPAAEIAAARASGEGPLSAELAAFAQSGLSVVIAACGLDGHPVAGRAAHHGQPYVPPASERLRPTFSLTYGPRKGCDTPEPYVYTDARWVRWVAALLHEARRGS